MFLEKMARLPNLKDISSDQLDIGEQNFIFVDDGQHYIGTFNGFCSVDKKFAEFSRN